MKYIFMAGLLASLCAPLTRAIDSPAARLSLRGVRAFDVVVDANNEIAIGLTRDDLQTEVEKLCKQVGIKPEKVNSPFLYVDLTAHEVHYANGRSANGYALLVEVRFEQAVLLERAPTVRTIAPTWSAETMVTVPSSDLRHIWRESVRELVDKFLKAFLEQNPK